MMRAIEIIRVTCRKAHPNYISAFENGEAKLEAAGINTPLRLAHFLAQCFHESGYLKILRENMNYSAKRITQVWPKRYPTLASAAPYANNPVALAEKSYGGRMGNGSEGNGDGYAYRGGGLIQCTGKDSYREFGRLINVDLLANPDLVCSAEYSLDVAIAEWTKVGANAYADRNAIVQISKAINVGNPNSKVTPVGMNERIKAFNAVWKVISDGAKAPSWEAAQPDSDIETVQRALVALGYHLDIDGRKGPETVKAIKAFQKAAQIAQTGIADSPTRAALASAIEAARGGEKAPIPSTIDLPPVIAPDTAQKAGPATLGPEVVREMAAQTETLQQWADLPIIKYACVALVIAGVVITLYGVFGSYMRQHRGAPS